MISLLYYLLQLFVIVSLSGCTLGPNYKAPTPKMPTHYTTKNPNEASQPITPFWHSAFNDPILNELITKALHGTNTDIQKAVAKISQARAELGMTQANFAPQLNASGRLVRDHVSGNSEIISAFPKGSIPLTYTDYRFGFDASWELDVFGHNRRALEASRAHFQSALENQYNVALITSAEIANLYTQYRVLQERVRIAQQTIESYNKTLKLVKLQLEAGVANRVDVNRVSSEVHSSKAVLPLLQADERATVSALAVLVGKTPEFLIHKLAPKAPIPSMNSTNLVVGLPSLLLQRRPDIKMAERELAAATAEVGVAVTNQFPRFQLIGRLGFDTTIAGTYFQSASSYWTYGPQVSLPIFQGGRLKQAVKVQEALAYSALANYKKTVLQALADVESSLIRYEKERARHQELVNSLTTLKNALELIRLQYKEGKTSLIDVLDVERQLNQLAEQKVQSTGQVTIHLIALYKALGGSWVNQSKG